MIRLPIRNDPPLSRSTSTSDTLLRRFTFIMITSALLDTTRDFFTILHITLLPPMRYLSPRSLRLSPDPILVLSLLFPHLFIYFLSLSPCMCFKQLLFILHLDQLIVYTTTILPCLVDNSQFPLPIVPFFSLVLARLYSVPLFPSTRSTFFVVKITAFLSETPSL